MPGTRTRTDRRLAQTAKSFLWKGDCAEIDNPRIWAGGLPINLWGVWSGATLGAPSFVLLWRFGFGSQGSAVIVLFPSTVGVPFQIARKLTLSLRQVVRSQRSTSACLKMVTLRQRSSVVLRWQLLADKDPQLIVVSDRTDVAVSLNGHQVTP